MPQKRSVFLSIWGESQFLSHTLGGVLTFRSKSGTCRLEQMSHRRVIDYVSAHVVGSCLNAVDANVQASNPLLTPSSLSSIYSFLNQIYRSYFKLKEPTAGRSWRSQTQMDEPAHTMQQCEGTPSCWRCCSKKGSVTRYSCQRSSMWFSSTHHSPPAVY
jgi:hypothetical protein